MKTSIRSIAIAGLMSGLIGTVQAGVIDPTQPVEGQSQLALSEQWWQWALGIPAASSPLTDTDGSLAKLNNTGNVFFLAGALGGSVSRTIEVPAGKPLFFPILNNIYVFTPEIGETCDGVADPVACALPYIDVSGSTNLHATLNGQNLLTYPSFRQTSTVLSTLNLPAGSFWDGVLNTGDHSFVTDGYWVALEPLATGSYTLVFGGDSAGGTLEVVDVLHVPEPDSLLLALCALGPLVAWRRRASREAGA